MQSMADELLALHRTVSHCLRLFILSRLWTYKQPVLCNSEKVDVRSWVTELYTSQQEHVIEARGIHWAPWNIWFNQNYNIIVSQLPCRNQGRYKLLWNYRYIHVQHLSQSLYAHSSCVVIWMTNIKSAWWHHCYVSLCTLAIIDSPLQAMVSPTGNFNPESEWYVS